MELSGLRISCSKLFMLSSETLLLSLVLQIDFLFTPLTPPGLVCWYFLADGHNRTELYFLKY